MRSQRVGDALSPVPVPRWLVIRDRFSRVLEYQALSPQTDLRAALQAERDRRAVAGWTVDVLWTHRRFFFCDRDGERVCVSIECFEPRAVRAVPSR